MKKTIFILAVTTFIAGAIFTGCQSSEKKVENAQDAVAKANENLDEANQKYLADIEAYRKVITDKIDANNKSIAEFKLRINKEKKEAREDYKKRINELEQKNNDIKKKLDDYKAQGKENWENFKTEFNHDMDELGQAFQDLTVRNTK